MDSYEPLDRGFAWTAARIAAVSPDQLELPTPCSRWNLEDLLDHTIESLTMLATAVEAGSAIEAPDAVEVAALGSSGWDRSIAALASRNRRAWASPGAMDRTIELPFGSVPAPVAASITLLELVVHGWDIGQANGEGIEIPEDLAAPVLDFAPAVEPRGDNFAADLGVGKNPSERVVAFLGRKPTSWAAR